MNVRIIIILLILILFYFKIYKSNQENNQVNTKEIYDKEEMYGSEKINESCQNGFTGEFCDEEIWIIDYSSSYDSNYFLIDKVFKSFNDALEFSIDKEEIIAITENMKTKEFFPVMKGAKIEEKNNFISFTRPKAYADQYLGFIDTIPDYSELKKELGLQAIEMTASAIKAFIIRKMKKKALKKAVKKYIEKKIQHKLSQEAVEKTTKKLARKKLEKESAEAALKASNKKLAEKKLKKELAEKAFLMKLQIN